VQTYIRRYLGQRDGDVDRPRIEQELKVVLGDHCDEQTAGALLENLDEYIKELGDRERQTEHALTQGMLADCIYPSYELGHNHDF
jgi:hypothetical protein